MSELIFKCQTCSVSIRLPSDNTRDFRCPECKTKYNSNGNLIIEDDVDIYKYDETSSNNEESSTVPLETSTEIPEDFKYNEEFKKYFEEMEIGRRRVGKECRSRWSPYH
mgnify:CR=1 FL=1